MRKPPASKAANTPPTKSRRISHAGERKEVKYYGLSACRAIWRHRPQDVIRIYLHTSRVDDLRDVLKWAAAERKAYHIVENEDLEKLTESTHHQGVCMLALEHESLDFAQLKQRLKQGDGAETLVYLDGVENPHNLGAIVRSCAHFGSRYVLGAQGHLPRLSPSAVRVAEGGAEAVALVYLHDAVDALRELKKAGYRVVATSVASGASLFDYHLKGRIIIALGAEELGVSRALAKLADDTLRVPGTGAVESLNVSVAFGVIAAEFYRQRQGRAVAAAPS